MRPFLSDAERRLSSAQHIKTALQRLARVVVPRLADFCFVFLRAGTAVRCAALAHRTPDGQRLMRDLTRVYRITLDDPVSMVAHVLRSGRPALRGEVSCGLVDPFFDERVLTLHRRLGARSVLVVPIGPVSDVLGAISLSYAESGRRYSGQDLTHARRLANVAAALLRESRNLSPASPPPLVQRRLLRMRGRA
jgi:GAF domain-containing protein